MQRGHEDMSSRPRPSCLKMCPHVFNFDVLPHVLISLCSHVLGPWKKGNFTRLYVIVLNPSCPT
jgi:hypothetical protein